MKMPLELREKTIIDIKIGEVGYIVPWSLYYDQNGVYISHRTRIREREGGTACLKVTRTQKGIVAFVNEVVPNKHNGFSIGTYRENDVKVIGFDMEEEKKLPESFYDLYKIDGYYYDIDESSSIQVPYFEQAKGARAMFLNTYIFATEQQAKASLALAQLTQLLKAYNGDWKPDWEDMGEDKYTIEYDGRNQLFLNTRTFTTQLLTFETTEKRDHFRKHHVDLIKQAAPLLWGVEIK